MKFSAELQHVIPIEPSWSLGHIETFGSAEVGDGWLKYMTMRREVKGKGRRGVSRDDMERKKGMQSGRREG